MSKRFFYVASLLLALVTSAGGYLLVTAFCADSAPAQMACHQMNQVLKDGHDGHSAMRHDGRETAAGETAVSNEQPFENCSHCISHSNLPQGAFALRQAETSRSSNQIDDPEVVTDISYVVLTPRRVNAREHAPPGQSSPLHVRINVFRI